jgi:enoyl-CoA hydratase/carnithine racemase
MSTATTYRYDTSKYRAPVHLTEHSPALLRFTLANPPINLFDPDVYAELRLLVDRMETDPELRVVIFDSADPDYFISHLDVKRLSEVPNRPGAANLADTWHDFVTRLAHAPVLSIALIRGRSRGIGNEFSLACDMRFASREKALLAQPEIGFGVVPGGGAFDWLPRLAGRSRTLEILASGDDFDADTAERYGWINRALPDAELDAFVDSLASRIAAFDKQALAAIKRLVNQRSAPPAEGELLQSFRTISDAITWPGVQARMHLMEERGWGADTEAELNHAAVVGELASELAHAGDHQGTPAEGESR